MARRSKYIDHQSGVSARFEHRQLSHDGRQRPASRGGAGRTAGRAADQRPGASVLSALGKLELDMMSSHQMSDRQVLEAIMAEAVRDVFAEYVDRHGLEEIAEIFSRGIKIEVGDMLPSAPYAERLKRVPPVWDKAFEVNAAEDRGRAGLVCGVRAGRPVQCRQDLPLATARTHRVRAVNVCANDRHRTETR